jgi:hypothetical protein
MLTETPEKSLYAGCITVTFVKAGSYTLYYKGFPGDVKHDGFTKIAIFSSYLLYEVRKGPIIGLTIEYENPAGRRRLFCYYGGNYLVLCCSKEWLCTRESAKKRELTIFLIFFVDLSVAKNQISGIIRARQIISTDSRKM